MRISPTLLAVGALLGLLLTSGVVRPPGDASAAPRDVSAPRASAPPPGLPAWARGDVHECKPQGPVALELVQLTPVDASGVLAVDVDIATFLPLRDVRVRVLLPDGAALLDDPADLLAPTGGWSSPPQPLGTPDERARGVLAAPGSDAAPPARARPGDPAADARPLVPGQRIGGALRVRVPVHAEFLVLALEVEGRFAAGGAEDERIVVQRRLVWGDAPDPVPSETFLDASTGAVTRRAVLDVQHEWER